MLGVPNHFHTILALRCARAGKHVVCTKPLARNRREANSMLDAVQAAGVLHGYAETEVFSPAVMKARKFIENGGIGKVLTVRSREAHAGPHEPWFWDKNSAAAAPCSTWVATRSRRPGISSARTIRSSRCSPGPIDSAPRPHQCRGQRRAADAISRAASSPRPS